MSVFVGANGKPWRRCDVVTIKGTQCAQPARGTMDNDAGEPLDVCQAHGNRAPAIGRKVRWWAS